MLGYIAGKGGNGGAADRGLWRRDRDSGGDQGETRQLAVLGTETPWRLPPSKWHAAGLDHSGLVMSGTQDDPPAFGGDAQPVLDDVEFGEVLDRRAMCPAGTVKVSRCWSKSRRSRTQRGARRVDAAGSDSQLAAVDRQFDVGVASTVWPSTEKNPRI